jgi:hypothetical protein
MEDSDSESDIGWYVSDVHAARAIGYLRMDLERTGYLATELTVPKVLELWGQALTMTMDITEPSPIGPDPELADNIVTKGLLSREYIRGSHITNCVQHMGVNITERPDNCILCLADLRNEMNHCISVNKWLNEWKDDATKLLRK